MLINSVVALVSIFSLNCLDAAHIIEYIEGEVVDKHIILKLWQESLGESYLIFQEEFDPKTVLLNHGRELFDLPTLYVSYMYEMYVNKLSLQQLHYFKLYSVSLTKL